MKNDIEKEIKKIERSIAEYKFQLDFIRENLETISHCLFKITFSGNSTRIVINNINHLHTARKFMRELYGKWNDKLENQFFSSGVTITTWVDKHDQWSIWLECSVEDYPEELLSEKCQWKRCRNNEEYSMVCSS